MATSRTIAKEAEWAIVKKDNKYQKLVENMPDAFAYHQIIIDKENNPVDYIFIEVNAAFETVSSLSRDSLIGKRVTEVDLSIQGDSFDWIGTYNKVTTKGESIRFEEYFEIADKWYNITAYSNNAGYFATIFSDVTENKKGIEALQNSEKRYRRLFESARDGILILDANTGKVLDANPLLIELSGHSSDSIREKYVWEIDLFKDIAPSMDAFKTLQSKEYICYEDLPLETKDGRIPVEFVSNVYLVDNSIYNDKDLLSRRSVFKEYKKPLVVSHVALLTLLKDLKKYKANEIVILINDASLMDQISGTSQTKKADVLRMASRVRQELNKFGDSVIIQDVSKDSVKMKEWKEALQNDL
ncbi:MAG: PAS domain-containing protein [Clostridiales bacterium]|jgi:PAS domain S-box-containing protein|nr:PAS domain-containing protein [Clostridiales bacterium]